MDLNQLRCFVDVANMGNFAAVAVKRDRDPSIISRAISGLEKELGFQLFRRTTRRLALTESGAKYLQRILPLLDEFSAAHDEALGLSAEPKGLVRLTASTAFGHTCLLPLVEPFMQYYPQLQLELLLSDSALDLIENGIDLACRLTPHFSSDMVGYKLFDTRYRVCASPSYLERYGALSKPEDLLDRECLVFNLPKYRSKWIFRDKAQSFELPIKSKLIISSALSLREAALQGLGPCLLADWLVDKDIESGALCDVFPSHQVSASDFETAAWLLYPSRHYLPYKTRVLIDFLKENLSN
ncbi:MAG: DNA-binding transcriptional LysR family regulator [Flavobacteriales bacterium]